MPEYLSPGVYVEEVPSANKPIAAVGTSTGAFVGLAEKGPVGEPVFIDSRTKFFETFGGYVSGAYLSYTVDLFFKNGGKRCYVVRSSAQGVPSHATLADTTPANALAVHALAPGVVGDSLSVEVIHETLPAFTFLVRKDGTEMERFEGLTMTPAENPVVEQQINGVSGYVRVIANPDGLSTYPGTPVEGTTSLDDGVDDDTVAALSASTVLQSGTTDILTVSAKSPGTWGNKIALQVVHEAALDDFSLTVSVGGSVLETYTGMKRGAPLPNQVEEKINSVSKLIDVAVVPGATLRPDAANASLKGGTNGIIGVVTGDFTGVIGLSAFDPIDDINIVAIPETADRAAVVAGLGYCEGRGDCFFVAHAVETADTAQEALAYKQATGSLYSGQAPFNSSFGALYAPWVVISDPLTKRGATVPPDGAIAGRYAATDIKRGVHKAAAGIDDGRIRGLMRLDGLFSHGEIETLNPAHVNALRHVEGVGDLIWGARTLSADPELRYVTTRRLLLFIEESIDQGTRWVVFEPNTPDLWRKIERNVKAFLRIVWRNGALFGAVEDEAFYVKCDAETNPPESIALGRVITEIGVAIVKPAEFVIFRISQGVETS